MSNFLKYSTFLAVLAVISMTQVQAACGGGGFSTAGKTTTSAPRATTINASHETITIASATTYSTRFDGLSAKLELTSNQWNDISKAKSDIDSQGEKLVKAQSKAQRKLDHCDGDCSDEKRNLARSTEDVNNFNKTAEFELRLRSILRSNQAATYFHS